MPLYVTYRHYRENVHGISSSLALQVFPDVSLQAGLKNVVPLEDRGPRNGLFLCLKCHSQLDKTAKLKANLAHLTTDTITMLLDCFFLKVSKTLGRTP